MEIAKRRRGLALFIVVVFHALAAPIALAAAPSQPVNAAALIDEGVRLRRTGRDDLALDKFTRAYELDPTPRAAAQKGLCVQALGRFTEAELLLAEALKGEGDPWVAKNRATIRGSLEEVKAKIGRIEITGSPAGAEVLVDGSPVGRLPLEQTLRLNAGPARIEVIAAGFASEQMAIDVQGGAFRRLGFQLKPATAQAVPQVKQEVAPDALLVSRPAGAEPEHATPIYKRWWFWAGVGAVVATGIAVAVIASGGSEPGGGTSLYPAR